MKVSNSKERLQEMMRVLDIRPVDISKLTGVTKSALSNYINGTREPRQDQISRIADPYGINPAWLMGYDVPMRTMELYYNEEILDLEIEFNQLSPANRSEALRYMKYLRTIQSDSRSQ